jgi:HAD superfamily hydrolase (TIGR01549 family)
LAVSGTAQAYGEIAAAEQVLDTVGQVIIPGTEPAPIKGVVFDFHATLVDTRDSGTWIEAARQRLDRPPSGPTAAGSAEFNSLREFLDRVWEHAVTVDPGSERDLSQERHHDVFRRTVEQRSAVDPDVDPELIEALYAVMPDQWAAFDDALPVLRELKARGLRVVVLSNTGLDIRACLDRAGILELIDGLVLSYEVGAVKPNPQIFRFALDRLEVPAGQALMVGDNWRDDAGGAALGIRTLILPRTTGPVHGLGSVLRLVG